MNSEILGSMYEYGVWANERLLAQAAKLSNDQLGRRWSQGYDSIHQTFVHLLGADRRWFARWKEETLPPMATAQEFPSLAAIQTAWVPLIAERRRYIAGLSEDGLRQAIHGRTLDGQPYELARWQGILQCANHATQHRSEIAAMLTDAGHSPGDLDYALYCRTAR
jgi:uncharacterized damage-inducible protein DinB